jgi:hypothetical protein
MADAKLMGAGKPEILDLLRINPLIDFDVDTSHVESVLSLLSFLVLDATHDNLTLSAEQAHVLAVMLNTCGAALQAMREDDLQISDEMKRGEA